MSNNFITEDTDFVTGDSPVSHDVNESLSRNANDGYISNDGPGDIKVEISSDGSHFSSQFVLQDGDVLSIEEQEGGIDTIRITWVNNSSYRINVI